MILHRVLGSGDKSVNLLKMLCKVVHLPCLGLVAKKVLYLFQVYDIMIQILKNRKKNHKIFIILIMEIWFSSV